MKILIIASKDNCVTQIAKVWLQKFDNDLEVYSAGVYGPGKLDNTAVQALKKYNIDISKSKCSDISLFSTDNWDYVISVDEEISRHDSGVKGYINCWLQIVLPDPSRKSGPDTLLNSAYERPCF